MTNTILHIQNASFIADNKNPILNNISLEVQKGEKVGVIGPNGAGKTTLLRLIYGTAKPSQGEILLEGEAIQKLKLKYLAQKVATVLQEIPQNFDLKVFEVVRAGRIPFENILLKRDKYHTWVAEALDKTGVLHLASRQFSTLSGGEKQRVLLARAIAQQPKLLLLDEPTNHLDLRHQWEIMELVNKIDCTVVCVLHDLNIAAHFCQTLYLINHGEIVHFGTPREVLTRENIRNVYGVEAKVHHRENDALQIQLEGISF